MKDLIRNALKIRDAIGCCYDDDDEHYCNKRCPYRDDGGCQTAMTQDAADIIDMLVEHILMVELLEPRKEEND